jgi:hypothetical protein
MKCNNIECDNTENSTALFKLLKGLSYTIFLLVIISQCLFTVLLTGSSPDSLFDIKWNIFKNKSFEIYPYFSPDDTPTLKEQMQLQERNAYIAHVREEVVGNWVLLYGVFMLYQIFFWIKYLIKYRYYIAVIRKRLSKFEHWNTEKLYTLSEKKEVAKVLWKRCLVLNTFVNKDTNGDLKIILQLRMPCFVGIEVKYADGIILYADGSKCPLDKETRFLYGNV